MANSSKKIVIFGEIFFDFCILWGFLEEEKNEFV